MTSDPKHLIGKLKDKKIVIIGDAVADQFLRGTIARVSREAPVFILKHDETETRAGGAANTAMNVASLGGRPKLIGLVGSDRSGGEILQVLTAANVDVADIISDASITTTTKIRVLAGQDYAPRQQVIRIDYENKHEISPELQERLENAVASSLKDADAVIVSDYGYGVASDAIFNIAKEHCLAKNIPLIVDSRFGLDRFHGATTATPNQEEVEQFAGKDFTDDDCESLREKLDIDALLVTRGNLGMSVFEKGKGTANIPVVGSKEPVDVTGAGDTVIAAYALALASGLTFVDAANIANIAGSIVVMKKGTATATIAELLAADFAERSDMAAN